MKKIILLIVLLFLLIFMAGCATTNYVPVVPAPITSFPPAPPTLIRMPVSFVFPSGSDMLKHAAAFFKNELRPKMDNPAPKSLQDWLRMLDLWKRLQKPIFLDKNIWLLLRPQTLSWGSMRANPQDILSLSAVLETTSEPEIVFGPEPKITTLPMPPVQPYLPGPPRFEAVSNIRISYQEANEQLKNPRLNFTGKVLPETGGQKVVLDRIRLYGSGGKVIVEVKLHYQPLLINLGTRPAKLTLYLRGTPHYVPEEQVFDLPDLDYDVKSSDLMVRVADTLFKDDFRNQLRQIARLRMGPRMEVLKAKINKALNRPIGPFVRLSAQVSSFEVKDGFADNEGVQARISLKGTISLEVTWN